MAKHTQTIRRQQPTNCFRMFDHFVGLALKELNTPQNVITFLTKQSPGSNYTEVGVSKT